ncbi:MAG: PAS domain S-box protein [Candidatus Auribacterota bacterium]|nr:PAS domain S-box protein [Candidatus Auribacterota bacterium]
MSKDKTKTTITDIGGILLIDDNPDDRALVIRALKKDFPEVVIREVIDSDDLGRALSGGGFDLVITDYHLCWTDGLRILREVKDRFPECPVIMFTGTGTEEVAVEAMKAGLDDYVLKSPKHFSLLPVTVRAALVNSRHQRALRESQQELLESEERFRNLFEISPAGIFLLDREGKITSVNNRGCMIYGYSRKELLKLNVRDIVPRGIAGNSRRLVETVRKKKYLFIESEGKRKNRQIFPLALSISLFRGRNEELIQVLVQDITDRKEAEEAERLRRLSEMLLNYQEEERKHIARELHDHIGQDLVAIKISLQMLEKEYPEMEEGLWGEIDEVVRIADKTITDVRRISTTLRPESLDRMGLVPALEHEIEYLSGRSDTELTFESGDFQGRLASEKEIAIYRIVQEGITNILKHAQADNARVRISRKGKKIHLSIRDDGVGFSPGWEKATMGLGLVGIKERVKGLGGSLTINSRKGKGAELLIIIPM